MLAIRLAISLAGLVTTASVIGVVSVAAGVAELLAGVTAVLGAAVFVAGGVPTAGVAALVAGATTADALFAGADTSSAACAGNAQGMRHKVEIISFLKGAPLILCLSDKKAWDEKNNFVVLEINTSTADILNCIQHTPIGKNNQF